MPKTDLERAVGILELDIFDESDREMLYDILLRNQNAHLADGSFDEQTWTLLRDTIDGWDKYARNRATFLKRASE